jgi:hypothetical protein
MHFRKITLLFLTIGLAINGTLPLHASAAEESAADYRTKEATQKFHLLKKLMLCFNSKEGCSKKQIALMITTGIAIAALITGTSAIAWEKYKHYKKIRKEGWGKVPEQAGEVIQEESFR